MKRSLAFAAAALFAGLGLNAAQSSCVTCHTSDASIKALYLPPSVSATEAEG